MRSNVKVCLTSLGCPKNLVNSEQMLYLLANAGFELLPDAEGADVAVVNTCGFIDSAKSEAIARILELGSLKERGVLSKIVVTGCLSERYGDEIFTELPEVDAIVGTGGYDDIVAVIERVLDGETPSFFGDIDAPCSETARAVSTGPGWAYLKVAEGCDNRCAYCVIPSLRGRYRSRPMENIIAEAKTLADSGVRELILVAQDVSRYGSDIFGKRSLCELLRALAAIDGVEWIRLHYLYPDEIDDELISLFASEKKIVRYFDIPIQHINSGILEKMNRRGDGALIRALFTKLRERVPGAVLRTSVITGLPGEGEAEFEELCGFLRDMKLERAGVFPYSPEDGTPAALMERPDEDTAIRRAGLVSELQARIMDEFEQSRAGSVIRVLTQSRNGAGVCYGRSEADSPDIDGGVVFSGACVPGEFADVLVEGFRDGMLIGSVREQGNDS